MPIPREFLELFHLDFKVTPEKVSLSQTIHDFWELARNLGLDPFPIFWEVLPKHIMAEIGSYGLPTRAHHWSYGPQYDQEMNETFSKTYEMIVNNNPSIAFMQHGNRDIDNKLVIAHCFGHSDFFKHNIYFAKTNRQMVEKAASNAAVIDFYANQYGRETVEDIMDIGFSLSSHIDPQRGFYREGYPAKRIYSKTTRAPDEFFELWGEPETKTELVVENDKVPPFPERDILFFLVQEADCPDWQKEILQIIREESYYFYPQAMTKVMNEGWACIWQSKILKAYNKLSDDETIDWSAMHAGLVRPWFDTPALTQSVLDSLPPYEAKRYGKPRSAMGKRLNPYWLGYEIFLDIEKRWDDYHTNGFRDPDYHGMFPHPTDITIGRLRDKEGNIIKSDITGEQKIRQVMIEECDMSFLRNYLTQELCEKLGLFVASYRGQKNIRMFPGSMDHAEDIMVWSRKAQDVIDLFCQERYNFAAPDIRVIAPQDNPDHLILMHVDYQQGTLDGAYIERMLPYIGKIWNRGPVILVTKVDTSANSANLFYYYTNNKDDPKIVTYKSLPKALKKVK